MARAELAAKLGQMAAGFRALALGSALDFDPELVRARDHALNLICSGLPGDDAIDIIHVLDGDLFRRLVSGGDLDRDAVLDLAWQMETLMAPLCADGQQRSVLRPDDEVEDRVLAWLARLLPAAERSRFVAEAHGNLGDCDRRWQRIDHLVCMAIGTPRLAWMMCRENRRGRA
jgi:hypothetical protein